MGKLIERTTVFTELPLGTGSALGSCIRALYLTASRKISIVGMKVSLRDNKTRNFNIFSPLDDASTALVSDLLLHITTEPYYIGEYQLSSFVDIGAQTFHPIQQNSTELMEGLYSCTVSWDPQIGSSANKSIISKNHFSSVFTSVCDYHGYKFPDEIVALSPSAKPLEITLYLSRCRGNFTQSDSSAHLDSYGLDASVIPVAGCGQRTSNCWFTVSSEDNAALETLTIHLAGDAICIEDDMQHLQSVCKNYMRLCETNLGNMS